MGAYLLRRTLISLSVLLGILIVTFILARSIPGNLCEGILGEKATQEMCDQLIQAKGLDRPIPIQLGFYMKDILRGDFGDSLRYHRPVLQILVERVPATMELSFTAFAIALLLGIPTGILAAARRNSLFDRFTLIGSNVGISVPVFWIGLMLAYVFAFIFKDTPFWLPPSGRVSAGVSAVPFYEVHGMAVAEGSTKYFVLEFLSNLFIINSLVTWDIETLFDSLKHLILPAVTLSIIPLAIIARITRASLLEVLGLDYIQTARAKGVRHRMIVLKHGFRNALIPIITVTGLQIGGLLSGTVLTETVFAFPGMGRMLFESITVHDYPVVQAITLVIAVSYLLVNWLVDLTYVVLDPRVRQA